MIKLNKPVRWLFAVAASLLFVYLLFMPLDEPLYSTLVFPAPDSAFRDIDKQLEPFKRLKVVKHDVSFKSKNGRLLRGVFLELPGTKRVFMYNHGKGSNIYRGIQRSGRLLLCGGSVFLYDYQGFGMSQGRISLEGACDDAVAAYDFLIQHEQRQPKDIIALGESLGSGVVGQLIQRRTVGGIIILSGFTSIKRAGLDQYPWLCLYPDWCYPLQIMDTQTVFTKKHPPLLIIHGTSDKTVLFQNAVELNASSSDPKMLYVIDRGGHCALGEQNKFAEVMKKFLNDNRI